MIVKLDHSKLFNHAKDLVNQGKYVKALGIFSKMQGYESRLNQIGCLLLSHDMPYAADLYREMLVDYGEQYDCFFDVLNLGSIAVFLLSFADRQGLQTRHDRDETKALPNADLIANFDFTQDEQTDKPDFDFNTDMESWVDVGLDNNFYDAKSVQYFDALRYNTEKAFFVGDTKLGEKLAKQLLKIETDHTPTVEAQLAVCQYLSKLSLGVKFALKLAHCNNPTCAGVGLAIETLHHANKQKHDEQLQQLLNLALTFGADNHNYDLESYVELSSRRLKNDQLSLQFANLLWDKIDGSGLDALLLCTCAFCNGGQLQKARQSAVATLNAMPNSCVAKSLVNFVNYRIANPQSDEKLTVEPKELRYYRLPFGLVANAQRNLALNKSEEDVLLVHDDYVYLDVLYRFAKSCIFYDDKKSFQRYSNVLRTISQMFQLQSEQDFVNFAKYQIAYNLPENGLQESLVDRLIAVGYRQRLLVSHQDGCYTLNLDELTNDDGLFRHALAFACTMEKVDVARFQKAYDSLQAQLHLQQDRMELTNAVAYALLCMTIKKFGSSDNAQLFLPEEKRIYNLYKETTTLRK